MLDIKSAFYAYAVLAKLELDCGNIEKAFEFARKAYEIEDYPLFISHLYCDIGAAAKKAKLNLEIPFNIDNLSEYFCPTPFDNYGITGYDFNTRAFYIGICECMPWFSGTDGAEGFNSSIHQKIRASIHDGSYRYCSRISCPIINNNLLAKDEEITDLRHKDIMERELTTIPASTRMHLIYDRSCNLRCPSCRQDFLQYSKEQTSMLNHFAETEILPFLNTTTKLWFGMEALASPHSLTILRTITPAAYPDLEICMQTNASHNLEAKWKELGDTAGLIKSVFVSIDGSNRQTFEKLRYPAKWDRLMANMEFLTKLKRDGSLSETSIRFVVQKDNYKQMADMLHLAAGWGVNNVCFIKIRKHAMPDGEFMEKNVFSDSHPLHDDFINEIARLRSNAKTTQVAVHFQGWRW
jgi:molybdenum cofactor biosynthesis enzyme MoaA